SLATGLSRLVGSAGGCDEPELVGCPVPPDGSLVGASVDPSDGAAVGPALGGAADGTGQLGAPVGSEGNASDAVAPGAAEPVGQLVGVAVPVGQSVGVPVGLAVAEGLAVSLGQAVPVGVGELGAGGSLTVGVGGAGCGGVPEGLAVGVGDAVVVRVGLGFAVDGGWDGRCVGVCVAVGGALCVDGGVVGPCGAGTGTPDCRETLVEAIT